jgi:hypothetical protein
VDFGSSINAYSIGDIFALENSPDPTKYKIITITDQIAFINRTVTAHFDSGSILYKVTHPAYTFNYESGILYFPVAYPLGCLLTCNYRYTTYSNDFLNDLLTDTSDQVAMDIDEVASLDSADQRQLIKLALRIKILENKASQGAESSILIKQGSTSLDLTGSNRAITNALDGARQDYRDAVDRYLMNQSSVIVGAAVVGRKGYSSTFNPEGKTGGGGG